MVINPKIHEINITNLMAIDLETSGLVARDSVPLVISLSNESRETYVLQIGKYTKKDIKSLLESLTSCKKLIAHNAKFDGNFLYHHYHVLYYNFFDTFLMSQVLKNGKDFKHALPNVIKFYTGKDFVIEGSKKGLQMSFVGLKQTSKLTKEQLEYAGEDTKHLIDLYFAMNKELKSMKLDKVERLESALLPVLIKMECEGCLIDVEKWKSKITEWEKILLDIEDSMDKEIIKLSKKFIGLRGGIYTRPRKRQTLYTTDIFGNVTRINNENQGNVNYGSQKQLIKIFELCEEEPPIDKEGKVGVGEDKLTTYINENPKSPLIPFIDTLLKYREYAKLISTYGEKFLGMLDKTNYIHTSYTQCSTSTGRLSSSGPNLQNIPGGRSAGGDIRNFFIARPGYKMITCDMNSAEVAIAADYSKEPLLLDSLLKGADMHSKLASVSFSIIFGEDFTVTKSEEPVIIKGYEFIPVRLRTDHKSVLFAKFYKAGAKRVYSVLSKYINMLHPQDKRLEIAKQVSDALDAEMPVLSQFLTDQINLANSQGYLRGSKLGRIRYWDNRDAYGDAANLPIQSTNSEAMKIALVNIDKYLVRTGYGRLVMNIHDEAVVEAKDEVVEEVAAEVRKIVADSLSWFLDTVEGGSSVNIQPYWEK